ncbi:unnamed protein product [Closterium sp. NIES-65]|nr:unnamed protein product [Closterium sp. NIES-65]
MRQLLVGDGLAGRMSLTFDIWTSENNVAFMGVTAHYVTSDFQLKQAVIDFRELKGSHTGDLIADELEEVLWEWGLEKMLFAVTCDNTENNSRAMRLLAGVPDARSGSRPRHPPLLSRWRHFRCMAHVVNLAVQAALKVDEVAEPLKRLRDVANYIGWSTLRTDRFFELQKGYAATRPQGPPGSRRPSGPLRLIVDCLTRWGSTLHMVNRGFELRMPIAMVFDDSDVRMYNALIDLKEKAQLTPGISPLRSSLITAALSKLERHMGGVSEEAAIATFLDPRQKLAPFKHRARAAEGNSRGATLELGPDRVKALVRARLPEYQAASTTALGDGGEVTSARGAGVHASAGGGAVDASANVSIHPMSPCSNVSRPSMIPLPPAHTPGPFTHPISLRALPYSHQSPHFPLLTLYPPSKFPFPHCTLSFRLEPSHFPPAHTLPPSLTLFPPRAPLSPFKQPISSLLTLNGLYSPYFPPLRPLSPFTHPFSPLLTLFSPSLTPFPLAHSLSPFKHPISSLLAHFFSFTHPISPPLTSFLPPIIPFPPCSLSSCVTHPVSSLLTLFPPSLTPFPPAHSLPPFTHPISPLCTLFPFTHPSSPLCTRFSPSLTPFPPCSPPFPLQLSHFLPAHFLSPSTQPIFPPLHYLSPTFLIEQGPLLTVVSKEG